MMGFIRGMEGPNSRLQSRGGPTPGPEDVSGGRSVVTRAGPRPTAARCLRSDPVITVGPADSGSQRVSRRSQVVTGGRRWSGVVRGGQRRSGVLAAAVGGAKGLRRRAVWDRDGRGGSGPDDRADHQSSLAHRLITSGGPALCATSVSRSSDRRPTEPCECRLPNDKERSSQRAEEKANTHGLAKLLHGSNKDFCQPRLFLHRKMSVRSNPV